MNGEIISLETAKHIADLEKENEALKIENAMNKENAQFKIVNPDGSEIKLTASELIKKVIDDNNSLSGTIISYKITIANANKWIMDHTHMCREQRIIDEKPAKFMVFDEDSNPFELLKIIGGDCNDSR